MFNTIRPITPQELSAGLTAAMSDIGLVRSSHVYANVAPTLVSVALPFCSPEVADSYLRNLVPWGEMKLFLDRPNQSSKSIEDYEDFQGLICNNKCTLLCVHGSRWWEAHQGIAGAGAFRLTLRGDTRSSPRVRTQLTTLATLFLIPGIRSLHSPLNLGMKQQPYRS